jgi:hypothetical protein
MAGAGAELSGESENSEPEEDLKRAAENDRQVDKAVAMTFPASDPIAAGETTSTEPPKRPTDRKPPVIRRGKSSTRAVAAATGRIRQGPHQAKCRIA